MLSVWCTIPLTANIHDAYFHYIPTHAYPHKFMPMCSFSRFRPWVFVLQHNSRDLNGDVHLERIISDYPTLCVQHQACSRIFVTSNEASLQFSLSSGKKHSQASAGGIQLWHLVISSRKWWRRVPSTWLVGLSPPFQKSWHQEGKSPKSKCLPEACFKTRKEMQVFFGNKALELVWTPPGCFLRVWAESLETQVLHHRCHLSPFIGKTMTSPAICDSNKETIKIWIQYGYSG